MHPVVNSSLAGTVSQLLVSPGTLTPVPTARPAPRCSPPCPCCWPWPAPRPPPRRHRTRRSRSRAAPCSRAATYRWKAWCDALKRFPGQLLEVELDDGVYEVEILRGDGVVVELDYDARSGKLLKTELDD